MFRVKDGDESIVVVKQFYNMFRLVKVKFVYYRESRRRSQGSHR